MQQSTSYDPLMKTNETIANVIASGKNYCQRDSITAATGVNTGTVVNHYITATLPLNILSDLFAKLPLVKGMYLKIVASFVIFQYLQRMMIYYTLKLDQIEISQLYY